MSQQSAIIVVMSESDLPENHPNHPNSQAIVDDAVLIHYGHDPKYLPKHIREGAIKASKLQL